MLLSLPSELLTHICAFIGPKSYLRLVCRELDVACLHTVKQLVFTDKMDKQQKAFKERIIALGSFRLVSAVFKDYNHCHFPIWRLLQSLRIDDNPIEDISGLVGIPEVSFVCCDNISDISPLATCRNVKLYMCPKIVDVSALCAVDCVSLMFCQSIVDVSALCVVRCLLIEWCDNILDLSMMGVQQEVFAFSQNESKTTVPTFNMTRWSTCKECCLSYLTFWDFHHFREIRVLRMHSCDIADISSLSECHALTCVSIIKNTKLQDVSPLQHVRVIKLEECPVKDISVLANSVALCIWNCPSVVDCSALGNVSCLSLHGCRNLTSVVGLGSNDVLDLSYCDNITDISMLGRVRVLALEGCMHVRDVSALGRVSQLYLKESGAEIYEDKSMQCLDHVEMLSLTNDRFDTLAPNHKGRKQIWWQMSYRQDFVLNFSFRDMCRRYGRLQKIELLTVFK